jgi:hypothetical protein
LAAQHFPWNSERWWYSPVLHPHLYGTQIQGIKTSRLYQSYTEFIFTFMNAYGYQEHVHFKTPFSPVSPDESCNHIPNTPWSSFFKSYVRCHVSRQGDIHRQKLFCALHCRKKIIFTTSAHLRGKLTRKRKYLFCLPVSCLRWVLPPAVNVDRAVRSLRWQGLKSLWR